MSSASRISRLAALLAGLALAAPAAGLSVCVEPDNLPFADSAGRGFENRLAALLAAALHQELRTVAVAQDGPGFLRATLGSGRCEALMGWPEGAPGVATTPPYYRSSWVFVSRAADRLDLRGFDDPRLQRLRIGVPAVGEGADTPPLIALGRRGLAAGLRLYRVGGERGAADPAAAAMLRDLADGRIDLALAWGPAAGYFAARQTVPLRLQPTPPLDHGIPFATALSVAVRAGNDALLHRLSGALQRQRPQVEALLAEYHVPTVEP